MKRIILIAALGAAIGLVVGYYFFGEIAGVQVRIGTLLSLPVGAGFGSSVRRAAQDAVGLNEVRRNILISGGVGVLVALFASRLGTSRGGKRGRRR